ncbi:MAG: cobalamin biosynthesis protein CbiG [Syntrophaceae bacterium PtaU1.Bin231]|nr:MAG: cobalamin biosynthesis protein CbiG [Syntrophaceae bacterium PtaU1.Bin231]
MKTALITLSAEGAAILRKLAAGLPEANCFVHKDVPGEYDAVRFESIIALTADIFNRHNGLIYIAPCGVVVRAIAPLITSKLTDPAVVVIDAGGRFSISLLSGHEGGANDLALQSGNLLGAEPVITTTTEALKSVIVGIGCRRGISAEAIVEAVREGLSRVGVGTHDVRYLASADIKAEEEGLLKAAHILGIPLRLISSAEIRASGRVFQHSDLARRKVNLPAVAEPAALLAGKRTRLIMPRMIWKGITVAIARESFIS